MNNFCPSWFYGKDILIDLVSMIVLLCIGYFSFQYHKLDKKRPGYSLFTVSFLLLSIAFIFKILTNFTIYYTATITQQIGIFTLTHQGVQSSDIFSVWGTLLFRTLTLLGFYLLYTHYYKKQERTTIIFVIYLLLITTYFSRIAYYIFHATLLLLLLYISYQQYQNYQRTKDKPAQMVFYSFITIALSQLTFIFMGTNQLYYVLAEMIQLIGYTLLLVSFLMVLHHGKKNKK